MTVQIGGQSSPPSVSVLLSAALELQARGFSVVPTIPFERQPAVAWEQYNNRRPSEIEIKSWWSGRPGTPVFGLAMVSGPISSNLTLDCDPTAGGSVDDLIAEAAETLGPLPPTCVVNSPSGGRHYHYLLPPGCDPGHTHNLFVSPTGKGKIELRVGSSICVMPPTWARSKKTGQPAPYFYTEGWDLETRTDISQEPFWQILLDSAAQQVRHTDQLPEPSQADVSAALRKHIPKLNAEARRLLQLRPEVADRSKVCWQFGLELLQSKIRDQNTLALLMVSLPAHRDKYGERGRGREWDAWGHAQKIAEKLLEAPPTPAPTAALTKESAPTGGSAIGNVTARTVSFESLKDKFRKPRFLIHPLLPRGELTILDGDGGVGKSWAALALAAGLSGSKVCPIPYDRTAKTGLTTLILTAEDDPYVTIGPRLLDLGADLSKVAILQIESSAKETCIEGITAADLPFIEDVIADFKPDLAIIDNLSIYQMSTPTDPNKSTEVVRILQPLKRLARQLDCGILLIRHFRKTAGRAQDMGAGSVAYRNTVRSQLVVTFDPDDPTQGRRLVTQGKMNLTAAMRESLVFTLEENSYPPFIWHGSFVVQDVDSLTDPARAERNHENKSAMDDAKEFLQGALGDNSAIACDVLVKEAGKDGVSRRTLYRAAKDLGVTINRHGFGKGSTWTLPSTNTH